MKTNKELFNELVESKGINAEVNLSISGDYYRLSINNELIYADSACEDLYDEDMAYGMFYEYIKENY